jgi:imidazolonepropionase-like amidohydrolase
VWERGGSLLDQRDLANDPLAKYAPASWKEGTWKRFTDMIVNQFNVDDFATRKKFVEKELLIVGEMHRAGVPFLAGTDTAAGVYVFPGFSLHEELELFVAAGFTPREALATATSLPARFLRREEELGSVDEGKLADLVLLDKNPLEDIRHTRAIFAVIANGRFFSREDLDRMLLQVEERARTP